MTKNKYIIKQGMKGLMVMILFTICFNKQSQAQQEPIFTQYMFNTLHYNPGYAGSQDMLSIVAISRHQWIGMKGAPSSQSLTIHSPVTENRKLNLGLSALQDKVGPISQSSFYLDIAFKLTLGEESHLAFGLKGGGAIMQGNFNGLNLNNSYTPDNAFAENIRSKFLPNFGFGAFYNTKIWYVGISAPRLLENRIENNGSPAFNSKETRHYFLTGGMIFNLSDQVKLKPTMLARLVIGAPASLDLTANLLFKEKLWFGLMHRIGDSFGGIVQFQFTPQFRIGYAYDYTTSDLVKYNSGTHEVMLGFDMNFLQRNMKSPRYF